MSTFGDGTFGDGTFGAVIVAPVLPPHGLPRFTFTTRCRPFLDLGVGDARIEGNAARWDVQRWDQSDAIWSGVEPTWQDVTCEAYEVRVVLGRERTTDRFDVGTMTVVAANISGWADLEPVDPGDINTLMLRPGRSIRFGVDHQTLGRVVLFRGFIDVVDPVYEPGANVVRLQCIDAAGEVGRVQLAADTPTGADETVAARVARILAAAQWPPSKQSIDGTSTALLAVAVDGQALDLLGQAADSAGGAIFGDTEANVCYRAQDWQIYPTTRPPDATIGNVAPGDVCPVRWERPYARADMATQIILANTREPTPDRVTRSDPTGYGLYGVETFERSDLSTRDLADLNRLADRYQITRGPDTIPRVRTVSLDARTGDDVADLLTAASPYRPSRYRCRLLLARGVVFDQDHYCTGLAYTVTPDGWTGDLNLDISAPYTATSAPRWEPASGANANLGRWDRAQWN